MKKMIVILSIVFVCIVQGPVIAQPPGQAKFEQPPDFALHPINLAIANLKLNQKTGILSGTVVNLGIKEWCKGKAFKSHITVFHWDFNKDKWKSVYGKYFLTSFACGFAKGRPENRCSGFKIKIPKNKITLTMLIRVVVDVDEKVKESRENDNFAYWINCMVLE
jgi:hypothetical protein